LGATGFSEGTFAIDKNEKHMDTRIIGAKIAQARKERNLSQAQLAQHIFISPQAVGKWERGESMPDITTFSRLAEILGVDLNYFSGNEIPGNGIPTQGKLDEPAPESEKETYPLERQVRINLTAADLQGSDFAGVVLHQGKFKAGSLQGADFTDADLIGCMFETVDARQARFDSANLSDCLFSTTDLADAAFRKTTLVRTTLSMSGQEAKFVGARLADVTFSKTDLTRTTFTDCVFEGVDFCYCDLRGLSFEGQTFIGVRFDKSALNDISFHGATLRNVSFNLPFSLTNKSYIALKTLRFEGAAMDKLTYAALKSLRVIDLSDVTVI
jgi:uncharacterized protein YjbI with pentapeptide repeats